MFTYPGGFDPSAYPEPFSSTYRSHLQHLKLKGLQPKTIDALSPAQLTDYFHDLVASHSWSAVKLDLYGFKFYTLHVLRKPWPMCFGPSFWPPWLKRGCRCLPTFPMRAATSAARINLIASVPTGCCGGAQPKTVPLG